MQNKRFEAIAGPRAALLSLNRNRDSGPAIPVFPYIHDEDLLLFRMLNVARSFDSAPPRSG